MGRVSVFDCTRSGGACGDKVKESQSSSEFVSPPRLQTCPSCSSCWYVSNGGAADERAGCCCFSCGRRDGLEDSIEHRPHRSDDDAAFLCSVWLVDWWATSWSTSGSAGDVRSVRDERRSYPPPSAGLSPGDACSIGRAYDIRGGVYNEDARGDDQTGRYRN